MTTTNNRIIKYNGWATEYIGIYIYNGDKYGAFAPWDVKNKGVPTATSVIVDNATEEITTNIDVWVWSQYSNAIFIFSSDMIASSTYIGRLCRFKVIPN